MSNFNSYLQHKLLQLNEYDARAENKLMQIAQSSFVRNNMRGGNSPGDGFSLYDANGTLVSLNIEEAINALQLPETPEKQELIMELKDLEETIINTESWFLTEWNKKLDYLRDLLEKIKNDDTGALLINDTIKQYIQIIKDAQKLIVQQTEKGLDYKEPEVEAWAWNKFGLQDGGKQLLNAYKYNKYNKKSNSIIHLLADLKTTSSTNKSKINNLFGGGASEDALKLNEAIFEVYENRRTSLIKELLRIHEMILRTQDPANLVDKNMVESGLTSIILKLINQLKGIKIFNEKDPNPPFENDDYIGLVRDLNLRVAGVRDKMDIRVGAPRDIVGPSRVRPNLNAADREERERRARGRRMVSNTVANAEKEQANLEKERFENIGSLIGGKKRSSKKNSKKSSKSVKKGSKKNKK